MKLARLQDGAILPLSVIIIPILLALISLALDMGYYFRTQTAIQRAADLGALGGVAYGIKEFDIEDEDFENEVEESASIITGENAALAGIDPDAPGFNIVPDYKPAESKLDVTITVPAKKLFGFIRFGPSTQTAFASASINVANIELVLDYSSSMRCPRYGSCECLTPARTVSCEASGAIQKITDLRNAVTSFLNRFRESRDRIGVTVFAMSGNTIVGINNTSTLGFDKTAIVNAVNSTSPQSNTNISDGLMRAYSDLRNKNILGQQDASVILFSDGAPTAMRFLATSPTNLPANNPYTDGNYDYTHYTVQWEINQSPGHLIRTEMLPFNHASPNPPTGSAPVCSSGGSATVSDDTTTWVSSTMNCVNNFGFYTPYPDSRAYGTNCAQNNPSMILSCWRNQYYNAAVAASDALRRGNVSVYSIGIGLPGNTPGFIFSGDPYENVTNSSSLKPILLTRIANDYLEATMGADHPDFVFQGSNTYAQINQPGSLDQGRVYLSPTSADLDRIFDQLAKKILLRLIR